MVSEKFRRQLRQEAESWWQQGVIDADQYEQLAVRYQFSRPGKRCQASFRVYPDGPRRYLAGVGRHYLCGGELAGMAPGGAGRVAAEPVDRRQYGGVLSVAAPPDSIGTHPGAMACYCWGL
ncbi:hypothetical protein XM38_021850 [Halomicronema hongdechloris C2206]|uniref:Uncharacterized protein n=1 Tax=Halomicronema hongdechloris C2206 TaxID=1641165 RepID=A0A1Z3HLP6_9CYAN|nr:hypothetical protein [Halomicronema hongdechloris]ASC71233.1 hypothetical protein XM38_021850 [Halomicronema hongdechloris C2206]